MAAPENLIFIHVPKTAGTTFRNVITKYYTPEETCLIYSDHPDAISQKEFLHLEETEQFKLLIGHFRFGLHERFDEPRKYAAFFRQPVARVISNYSHIKRNPGNKLHKQIVEQNISLEEFVSRPEFDSHNNLQVKMVAGNKAPRKKLLETATRNIENHFAAIGLTERFNESLILFKKKYRWFYPVYRKKNVNQNKKYQQDVPESVKQVIREKNSLDIEFYQYIKTRFEEEVMQNKWWIKKELLMLKMFNLLSR